MSKTLKFESKIIKFEAINPLFSKVKIRVAYAGLNRNNSYISKETFDNALNSLIICPILGEYNQSLEDFRGHGGKIEVTDNSIQWVNTTIPYGAVDTDTEITWEDVIEDDGTVNSYLCVTGYLWTGRYPELSSIIENSKGQSMEIEILSGDYTELDGNKVYNIDDFVFTGFCILGDDVEPCFESSEIMAYSLDKDNFKHQFNQMISELRFSLQQSTTVDKVSNEGGKNMDELQELLAKYSLTLEDLSSKEIKHEEFSLEDLELKIQEVFKEEEPKEEFTLTSEQLEDELKRELSEVETVTENYWGEDYSYPRFSFVDYMPEQSMVVAYDNKENFLVGFAYALINENVEVDADSLMRYKVEFVPMNLAGDPDEAIDDSFSKNFTSLFQVDKNLKVKESELNNKFSEEKLEIQESIDKLNADFTKLQEDYTTLEEKANELEQFKLSSIQKEREDIEETLFSSFSSELTDDEMSPIKEIKSQLSIEEIEEKLFALAGRKKAKLVFNKSQNDPPIRFSLPVDDKPTSDKEYADLIEKHRNK